MRSREAGAAAAFVAFVALGFAAFTAAGCGPTSHAPPGLLPPIRHAARDPYGAWATVTWHDRQTHSASGELISITRDQTVVMRGTEWTEIPTTSIERVVIEPFEGGTEVLTPFSRLSRSVNPRDLARIARYARFPAGMPPGVDRTTILSRPTAAPDSLR